MADLRPVLILSARHRPLEISILVSGLLTGLLGLINYNSAGATRRLDELIPGYTWVFYAGLFLGSSTALVSIFLNLPTSLILERIGLTLMTMFLLGYAVSSIIIYGVVGLSGAWFISFISFGCVGRICQLNRDIKSLQGIGVGK